MTLDGLELISPFRNGSFGIHPGLTRRTSPKVGYRASMKHLEYSGSSWIEAFAQSFSAKSGRSASSSCAKSGQI